MQVKMKEKKKKERKCYPWFNYYQLYKVLSTGTWTEVKAYDEKYYIYMGKWKITKTEKQRNN